MKTRWLNLLMLVALVLGALPMMAPPSPVSADRSLGQEPSDLVVGEIADATEPSLYIVQLHAPALASYSGGIPNLEATSPSVTGAEKLDVETPASMAYLTYLQAEQRGVLSSVERTLGRPVEVAFQYLAVLNGFAVTLSPREAARVAALPQVRAVYRDVERELDTDVGPQLIGAPAIWNGNTGSKVATRGEGIVIGVIDSGINSKHPSFAAVDGDGYTHINPYGAGTYKGWCAANPSFCNSKLIAAYTFHPNGGSPEDTDGHGSHTASTAGGNAHTATFNVGADAYAIPIQGVAPRANIVAYKVCDPSCPNTSSIAAINSAVLTDQVDVLNYSISGGDSPWTDPVDLAFLDAHNAGIFVSASAGNSGSGPSTVAHTGPWNAAVAASTHNRAIVHTLSVTLPAAPASLQGLAAVPGENTSIPANITGVLRYDPSNALGCDPFAAGTFTGSLALMQRGGCTFTQKVNNAVAAGATHVVIFNSVGGPPISMGGLTGTPAAVMLDLAGGQALRDYVVANPGTTVRINAATSLVYKDAWTDIVAGFSSRGPSQFELLKPDYIAPGVNILAAVQSKSGVPVQYGFQQGTSMSSPHAAGAAALMMALQPAWSPSEIKSALASTAVGGLVKEDGLTPADPFDAGSGRLDLSLASTAGLVFSETGANYAAADPATGGDPKTLNLPSMLNYACEDTCTWTRTVKSVLPVAATYTAATTAPPGMIVTVTPGVFTLNPGETRALLIRADVTGVASTGRVAASVTLGVDTSAPVVLQEAFTESTFPPTGWSVHKLQGGGTTTWIRDTAQSRSAPSSARRVFGGTTDGFQDDWLVTPPLALSGPSVLSFYDRGQWMGDYGYHGVWVSTASCNPADGAFVEVREVADTPNLAWRATPVILDLSPYTGTTVCLAFRYSGNFAATWWIDDVVVGPLSVADTHMPIVVFPAAKPEIVVAADPVTATQTADTQTALVLDIGNVGSADLEWFVQEGVPMTGHPMTGNPMTGRPMAGDPLTNDLPAGPIPPAMLNLPVGGDRATPTLTGGSVPASILPTGSPAHLYGWSESFDDITLLPGQGWALINNSAPLGTSTWFQGNTGVFNAHSGAANAYIAANFNNTAGAGTISNWLLAPQTVLNNGDTFSFWTRRTTSIWQDRLQVRMSTAGVGTDVGATATSVGDFTTLLLDINPTYAAGGYPQVWTRYELTISGLSGPTSGRLAFRYFVENGGPSGSASDYIGIDSVVYTPALPRMLYDNGPFITSYGDGPGGSDASLVQNVSLGLTTLGFSVYPQPGDYYRIADEFTVSTPGGWSIDHVSFYAYQTGAPITSTFTGVNYRIWDGPPNDPASTVVFGDTTTNRMVDTRWTGAYRYAENNVATTRPVMSLISDAGLQLPPGTYWLDWQVSGSHAVTAWQPPVTRLGETSTGNALQLLSTGWGPVVDTGAVAPQGAPFKLWGSTVCDAPADVPWLSVSPSSGTTLPGETDQITVTLDSTGLAVGDYTAYLCVNSNDAQTPVVVIPVSLEVIEVYTVEVTVNPAGGGSVAIDPEQATYVYGDQVTLTATAAPGWLFAGWSGGATGTAPQVILTVQGNTAVTATFTEIPAPVYRVLLPLLRRN